MKPTVKWLCRQLGRSVVLFLLGLLLLLALWLLLDRSSALLVLLLLLALIGLLVLARIAARLIAARCRKASAAPKGRGSVGHRGAPRVTIPSHTYKRPDPLVYSQSWLMAQGLGVTWDNPDIQLIQLADPQTGQGEGPVSSHELAPSTIYRIRAQVWNGSTEAPAVNVQVRFYYLSFGIGTARNYIGEVMVNLPVKGAPGLPAIAEHDWKTPELPGHYCIQVELVWPDDANPANNLGQENVDVKALNSPTATFEVPVRNDARVARTLVLQADAYAIPPLPECPPSPVVSAAEGVALVSEVPSEGGMAEIRRPAPPTAALRDAREQHARTRFSIPTGFDVELLPSGRLNLEPGEEKVVTVRITAPDAFTGRLSVNVSAHAHSTLVGGVTLYFHD